MRSTVAAVLIVAVVLVGYYRAPLVPVAVGAAIAAGWVWWRKAGVSRRGVGRGEEGRWVALITPASGSGPGSAAGAAGGCRISLQRPAHNPLHVGGRSSWVDLPGVPLFPRPALE